MQELFLRVLPRLTWSAFLTVLVVWICRCGAGLRTWSQEEPGPAMSLHYLFMGLAWPVCMTEAILSYRAPLVPFRQRRCARPDSLCRELPLLFVLLLSSVRQLTSDIAVPCAAPSSTSM